jgi:hypothetical protein
LGCKKKNSNPIKKDLVVNLKDNPEMSILVEESIKDGKDGKYLMLLVKKYNISL